MNVNGNHLLVDLNPNNHSQIFKLIDHLTRKIEQGTSYIYPAHSFCYNFFVKYFVNFVMLKFLISTIKFTIYLILIITAFNIFRFTDDHSSLRGWDFNFKFNRLWNVLITDDGLMYNRFFEEETNKIRPILNTIAYLMLLIPICTKVILPLNRFFNKRKIKKRNHS